MMKPASWARMRAGLCRAVFVYRRAQLVARAFFLSENPREDDESVDFIDIASRSRRARLTEICDIFISSSTPGE